MAKIETSIRTEDWTADTSHYWDQALDDSHFIGKPKKWDRRRMNQRHKQTQKS